MRVGARSTSVRRLRRASPALRCSTRAPGSTPITGRRTASAFASSTSSPPAGASSAAGARSCGSRSTAGAGASAGSPASLAPVAWGRIATTSAVLSAVLAPAAPARSVPALRTHGDAVVVCAADSASRTRRSWSGRDARPLLRLLGACHHRSIQAAVDAAGPGGRVAVLPGVYRERVGIRHAGVQLEGLGRRARDVVVRGEIRADRADGLVLAGLTAEQGGASSVLVARTDGFRAHRLVVRWAQDDGLRTSGSDHGLIDRVEAYGNGGAGIRVGPGARGDCGSGHGIEVRDVDAYGNVVGFAADAAGATWLRRSRLAGNATGVSIDSYASGPATPRGCPRLEHLSVAANNADPYATPRCGRTRPGRLCPRLATPVGSGIVLRGVNGASVRDSAVYGNRRAGVQLAWAPASARGQRDPARQFDTAHGNRFERNRMGLAAANRVDFAWDGEGARNCWSANAARNGAAPTSMRGPLPACPAGSLLGLGDPATHALEAPCAAWAPGRIPPGCDWFTTP